MEVLATGFHIVLEKVYLGGAGAFLHSCLRQLGGEMGKMLEKVVVVAARSRNGNEIWSRNLAGLW